jgi:hypothetical protein
MSMRSKTLQKMGYVLLAAGALALFIVAWISSDGDNMLQMLNTASALTVIGGFILHNQAWRRRQARRKAQS